MRTIEEYCRDLGWSQTELAKQTGVTATTIRKAQHGQPVSGSTASAIAKAFSTAFGERILVKDIKGLNVSL